MTVCCVCLFVDFIDCLFFIYFRKKLNLVRFTHRLSVWMTVCWLYWLSFFKMYLKIKKKHYLTTAPDSLATRVSRVPCPGVRSATVHIITLLFLPFSCSWSRWLHHVGISTTGRLNATVMYFQTPTDLFSWKRNPQNMVR